jgi:hypothetical protein
MKIVRNAIPDFYPIFVPLDLLVAIFDFRFSIAELLYVCFFWITGSHNFRRIKVEQYFKGNNKREIMTFTSPSLKDYNHHYSDIHKSHNMSS